MQHQSDVSDYLETIVLAIAGVFIFFNRILKIVLSLGKKIMSLYLKLEECKILFSRSNNKGVFMVAKYDITQTKEMISFGVAIVVALYTAKMNDGKIDQKDLGLALPILMELPGALDGMATIPAELKDLDEKELEEIKNLVIEKLPGIGEKWQSFARHALMVGIGAVGMYQDLKEKSL